MLVTRKRIRRQRGQRSELLKNEWKKQRQIKACSRIVVRHDEQKPAAACRHMQNHTLTPAHGNQRQNKPQFTALFARRCLTHLQGHASVLMAPCFCEVCEVRAWCNALWTHTITNRKEVRRAGERVFTGALDCLHWQRRLFNTTSYRTSQCNSILTHCVSKSVAEERCRALEEKKVTGVQRGK